MANVNQRFAQYPITHSLGVVRAWIR